MDLMVLVMGVFGYTVMGYVVVKIMKKKRSEVRTMKVLEEVEKYG